MYEEHLKDAYKKLIGAMGYNGNGMKYPRSSACIPVYHFMSLSYSFDFVYLRLFIYKIGKAVLPPYFCIFPDQPGKHFSFHIYPIFLHFCETISHYSLSRL